MTELSKQFVENVIKIEGGFVDNPADSGGPTKYGITEYVARQYGYRGFMKDLPVSLAKQITKEKYWDALRLDEIANLAPCVALELADTAVNCGVARAGEFMQRLLNVLNKNGILYNDLKIDGSVGPTTIKAFRSYVAARQGDGLVVFMRGLNCLQGEFYVSLAERRQKDEAFIFGWLLNRIT